MLQNELQPAPHKIQERESSCEDEVNVGNVTGQQPQPSQWTLLPKPRRRVVQTFTGAPKG